ncbi:bis(5'-nucleosyl)-tetraphosphatase (symmetrical) YqeK [Streptococcus downei]|uniref:bis(5'-nucleosyl)-tetraphosphatase (symmetrical) n=1 Tax=Streptococcus downei MFe28 TaxID=764290 RepID=A0A380JCG9_STRDO|nr:bis(5'-nucleosyl)-tetraphosphatase (symmetrical) YqeK [Streptococcus downei]EFQ56354.1 hydrolase, HD family [Streptococcus downei F0415]SUN35785.1 HAD superfamily hydrolase [Streptococcus downei MFe28]
MYEKFLGHGYDRDQVLKIMQDCLSAKRFQHCLGVEAAAQHLAQLNDYSLEKAGLAGLLHDYAKELSDSDFLALIDKYSLDPDLKNWGNNIWHGKVGIYKIKEDLGVTDAEILKAIEDHTTGSHQMTTLDKIVYVADYIEDNRDFPGVNQARQIAEQSLDKAVAYETAHTLTHLIDRKLPIYPQTIDTYNAFVGELRY